MGYEHKIYVVNKSNLIYNGDNKKWGDVIAEFNFACFPCFETVFKKKADCYVFQGNSDEQVVEDMYGDELTEAKVSDVIEFLEEASKTDNYRRINPLLGLLKGFDESQWDNLAVLHFGY